MLLHDNVASCVARILSVAPPGAEEIVAAAVPSWLALLPPQRDTAELAPVVRGLAALHRAAPTDPRRGALPSLHERLAATLGALLAALAAPAPVPAPTDPVAIERAAERTAADTAAAREAAPVLRTMLQQNPALASFIQTNIPQEQQVLLSQLLSS